MIGSGFAGKPSASGPFIPLHEKSLKEGLGEGVNWRKAAILAVSIFWIWLLWDTSIIYPLKLLVVSFHELSHGLMAVLTGGTIDHIEITPREGGACICRGGNQFLILTAGYLGSLFWGGGILLLSSRSRFHRWISITLGILMLTIGLIFVRPLVGFGQLFVISLGLGLCASGWLLNDQLNDWMLKVIGLTSCMYATLDIKKDVLDGSSQMSDAALLSKLTGVSSTFWGIIWISSAVFFTACFLLHASKQQRLLL